MCCGRKNERSGIFSDEEILMNDCWGLFIGVIEGGLGEWDRDGIEMYVDAT